MKFFDLDPSLEDAVFDPEKGVGIRIEVEKEDGSFETLSDDAVNEAHFSSGFDSKGGITAFASVLLDDDGSFSFRCERERLQGEDILYCRGNREISSPFYNVSG